MKKKCMSPKCQFFMHKNQLDLNYLLNTNLKKKNVFIIIYIKHEDCRDAEKKKDSLIK